MPTEFHVIAARGIVVVRHFGHLTVAESRDSFARYLRHPQARPGQNHLVDCSDLTSYEHDFAGILKLQADIAETFSPEAPETLLILYGPPGIPHEVATIIRNSWEGTGSVIPRVVTAEAEALAILGQPERRISELLALA